MIVDIYDGNICITEGLNGVPTTEESIRIFEGMGLTVIIKGV